MKELELQLKEMALRVEILNTKLDTLLEKYGK